MKYITEKDIVTPIHKKDSHKGQNGEVLIIGGSQDYVGCLALAGLASLRTGIDWITIAAPEKVSWAVSCLSPDLITKKCKGKYLTLKNYNEIIKLVEKHDAILIGNGMGRRFMTRLLIKKLVKNIKKPLVIDADAIKAIKLQDVNNCLLTPHKKEYKILLENSKIDEKDLKKFIKNNIILKKGRIDEIITKENILYNKTGNERMTIGGTGDTLTGIISALIAQKIPLFDAAYYGAHINGKAGDMCFAEKGYGLITSDIIEKIPEVIKHI